MKARVAIEQSVFDFAIREINALEDRIVKAEDKADAMLWEQAERVVEQLKAGISQRELARQWINVRTGDPYDHKHVFFVKQAWKQYGEHAPRPRFRDAYNEFAHASNGAHVGHNSGNNEWYTPAEYIEAAREVLGEIDLDPASSPRANQVVHAQQYFTTDDDGLTRPWAGRVWMNPPYAQPLIAGFADKFAASVRSGDVTAAIALVNNATETDWFATLATVATAVCFPQGRVRFWSPDDNETAAPLQGQALIYAGGDVPRFRHTFRRFGRVFVPVMVTP